MAKQNLGGLASSILGKEHTSLLANEDAITLPSSEPIKRVSKEHSKVVPKKASTVAPAAVDDEKVQFNVYLSPATAERAEDAVSTIRKLLRGRKDLRKATKSDLAEVALSIMLDQLDSAGIDSALVKAIIRQARKPERR